MCHVVRDLCTDALIARMIDGEACTCGCSFVSSYFVQGMPGRHTIRIERRLRILLKELLILITCSFIITKHVMNTSFLHIIGSTPTTSPGGPWVRGRLRLESSPHSSEPSGAQWRRLVQDQRHYLESGGQCQQCNCATLKLRDPETQPAAHHQRSIISGPMATLCRPCREGRRRRPC